MLVVCWNGFILVGGVAVGLLDLSVEWCDVLRWIVGVKMVLVTVWVALVMIMIGGLEVVMWVFGDWFG